MTFGIQAKVTAAATVIVALLTGAYMITSVQSLEDNLQLRLREHAMGALRVACRVAADHLYIHDERELTILAGELVRTEDIASVEILDSDGKVIASAVEVDDDFDASTETVPSHDVRIIEDEQSLRAIQGVMLGEYLVGSIHITVSKKRVHADVAAAMWRPVALGILITFVAFALIVTCARGITEPLGTLIAGTRAVSQGDFSRQIDISTNDELSELADAFNLMTRSLERSTVSRAYVEGIVESMKDMLLVVKPDGEIRTVNAAARAIFDCRQDELEGGAVDDFVCLEGEDDFSSVLRSVMEANTSRDIEVWFKRAGAVRVPVALSLSPMSGTADARVICVGQDISRRREIAHAQREARVAAEQANAAKSEFLANMSHEIRTPMTAILGYADLLLEQEDVAERRTSVETIRRNGRHLLTLINDILDLSKIEAGKMTVETVAFAPSTLLREVGELLEPRAASRGIRLEVVEETELPAAVASDPTKIRQILTNLVGNAIKFTSEGSVTVRASHEPIDAKSARVTFAVEDTGIGLTSEQAANLFSAFTQADTSTTRRFGGTGLGLAISRHMSELLGGTIEVESEHGKGSTFTANMVVSLDTAGLAGERSRLNLSGDGTSGKLDARVLLAEDGRDNQRLIAFVLKKIGATVVVANDGREAVDMALEAQDADDPFDVILMDMQMPVLDGYSATAELRAQRYVGPIIALTANAMEGDRDRCLHAGCDDYTTKPIKRAELVHLVRTYAATTVDMQVALGDTRTPSS